MDFVSDGRAGRRDICVAHSIGEPWRDDEHRHATGIHHRERRVWVLRKRSPELARPFPGAMDALTPILGIGFALLMMASLPLITWIRLLVWLLIGLVIYFLYSRSTARCRSRGCSPKGSRSRWRVLRSRWTRMTAEMALGPREGLLAA